MPLIYEKVDGKLICIDSEIPFELPAGWAWCRLNACCVKEIRRGKSPKYDERGTTLVFAQKCNTKHEGINISLALRLDDDTLVKYPSDEYMVSDDIVINSTGTGTLGRVGIYRDSDASKGTPVVPDSHITIIRTSIHVRAEYIYTYLKSMQATLEKMGEGSTNQKELKPISLISLLAPIPPLHEQDRIITGIENMMISLSTIL